MQGKEGVYSIGSRSAFDEMNSTEIHGHCFDLVEDALLSMIHERMPPPPRKDGFDECYSPTLGGYFQMYSRSRRHNLNWNGDGWHGYGHSWGDGNGNCNEARELEKYGNRFMSKLPSSIHSEERDWRRMSPSSYFLFGSSHDGQLVNNNDDFFGFSKMMMQQIKDSIRHSLSERILGQTKKRNVLERMDEKEPSRPTTTYLQLLDMYGEDHHSKEKAEEEPLDDWLGYVDRTQS